MLINPAFWNNKRVFLTGHTGFKGSWLTLWLSALGAKVYGFALNPPTNPALFIEAQVSRRLTKCTIGDVREYSCLLQAIKSSKPDIIFHLAAQPLVLHSYSDPVDTYSTNVMGTVHLLEAVRKAGDVRAVVNVTTDKCYENKEWLWGYREDEAMGGIDPYSNSKGCSELITSAFRRSFFDKTDTVLASARAGNVIGGGDWAKDRLVPDILRAFEEKQPVVIRNPLATRPWQHVLEPLSGYLVLAQKIYQEGQSFADAWNFGPNESDVKPVKWIVEELVKNWGINASWKVELGDHQHEAHYLKLDTSKAKKRLEWHPCWNLSEALNYTTSWHQSWLNNEDMQDICLEQINFYNQNLAKKLQENFKGF